MGCTSFWTTATEEWKPPAFDRGAFYRMRPGQEMYFRRRVIAYKQIDEGIGLKLCRFFVFRRFVHFNCGVLRNTQLRGEDPSPFIAMG